MEKSISIRVTKTGIEVYANFSLFKGHSKLEDVWFDSFESILHSFETFIAIEETYAKMDKETNLNLLQGGFKKWGFKIIENINIAPKIEKNNTTAKIKKHLNGETKFPTILTLDLKSYINSGSQFKKAEAIIEGKYDYLVSDVLDKALSSLGLPTGHTICVYELKAFLSHIERKNSILPRLNRQFKGIDILEFLKDRREEDIIQRYKKFYNENEYERLRVGERTDDRWLIVDANRIYDLIYKFGTQNKKAYYLWQKWFIVKPYRWDHVIVVDEDYLNSLADNELITFDKIRKIKD